MRDLAPLLLDCVRMKSLCTLQSYPGNLFTRGGGNLPVWVYMCAGQCYPIQRLLEQGPYSSAKFRLGE